MNNKLEKIISGYQYGVHPASVLLSDVMKFFQLDYDTDICFGLGCGLGFELPELNNMNDIPFCFNIENFSYDLAYSTGVWCIEYRTPTAVSFWEKLNEKWFEWIRAYQPMPIYTILPKIENIAAHECQSQIMEPYLLIGIDIENSYYSFIDKDSRQINLSFSNTKNIHQDEFYYAIFHPPLNFITNADKFMKFNTSIKTALCSTVQRMLYGFENTGISGMNNFLRLISDTGNEKDIIFILTYYYKLCQCNKDNNGLYRMEFGKFLIKAGIRQGIPKFIVYGEKYKKISELWTYIFDLLKEYYAGNTHYTVLKSKLIYTVEEIIQSEMKIIIEIESALNMMYGIHSLESFSVG